MSYTCKTCGPLSPIDVIDVTDYDRPSGTVIEYRACSQCEGLATPLRRNPPPSWPDCSVPGCTHASCLPTDRCLLHQRR